MKTYRIQISVVLVCVLGILFIQTSYAETANPLIVSCDLRSGEYYSGMPLPLDVTVSNSSDQVVYINVVNKRPVEFDVKRKGVDKDPKRNLRIIAARSNGSPVPPKSTRIFTYMVNKFVSLDLEGEIDLSYKIWIDSYTLQDEYTIASRYSTLLEGEIQVNLGKFDEVRLKKVLDEEIKRLPSNDPLVVLEVAESVCYLDNPIALDYVGRIIEIGSANVQYMVLEALMRFNDDDRSKKFMLEYIDPEGDANVVSRAFTLLASEKVKLERSDVKKMLESPHFNIRYRTLEYIQEMGVLDYLDLIKPLIEDENDGVAGLAVDILSVHKDQEKKAK